MPENARDAGNAAFQVRVLNSIGAPQYISAEGELLRGCSHQSRLWGLGVDWEGTQMPGTGGRRGICRRASRSRGGACGRGRLFRRNRVDYHDPGDDLAVWIAESRSRVDGKSGMLRSVVDGRASDSHFSSPAFNERALRDLPVDFGYPCS